MFKITPHTRDKLINAGFFPFINLSTIDLSDFGIYGKDDERRYNESCLILAIRQSGILNVDENNRLKHFVKTRLFPINELPKICEEFDIQIDLRLINGDTTHNRTYGNNKNRIIKLLVMYGHYMIDKLPQVSSFFLSNYDEFKNQNTMTFRNKEGVLMTTKTSLSIKSVIDRLLKMNLLIPMTDDEMIKIKINFKIDDDMNFNHQRLIKFPENEKHRINPYAVKPKQTKFFFGYDVEPDEIDERLNELQEVIDSLPLPRKINVSNYYRYSNLMQRIMYEYGCFDGVYESTGRDNQELRNSIKFPRPYSDFNSGEPFEIKEKLYYIDMNSSYMSFINGIPTDLTMKERNYRINDLIHTLYDLRKQYKKTNPKLATTLKFIMNSCYGYSLRKQKTGSKKYSKNIEDYISKHGSFVVAVYKTYDNIGFVYSKERFATDYNCAQFGADILKNYNSFMDKIRSTVKVIYENIDAILITEDDFNKLNSLGYIGDNLGNFKIEHIFTLFKYASSRKWFATCLDGSIEKRGKWKE